MKVLSDNTADKLVRLLAGSGTPPPRQVERPAPTTPPALMWQIHVTFEGAVTVDGGDIYRDGTRYTLDPSAPGNAEGDCLVVWSGSGAGSVSLATPGATLGKPFRILGKIKKDGDTFSSIQYIACPIELYSAGSGGGDGGGDGGDDGGDDEETPGGQNPDPNNPPPCGNPLNANDDDDPLSDDAGDDGDYNPLNYEGEGGYTPTCYGDDAA